MTHAGDPTWERLEDQIAWYDTQSARNQRDYKRLKYVEIVAAAAIPVVTGLDVSRTVPAILGGLVLLIEAILHLNQLKHEKYLYLGHAAYYTVASDPRALLAMRVEGLVSREHARWVSAREEAEEPQVTTKP